MPEGYTPREINLLMGRTRIQRARWAMLWAAPVLFLVVVVAFAILGAASVLMGGTAGFYVQSAPGAPAVTPAAPGTVPGLPDVGHPGPIHPSPTAVCALNAPAYAPAREAGR